MREEEERRLDRMAGETVLVGCLIHNKDLKIITVKSLISALPLISAPFFFMIANYKELKEKFEIFRETNAKKQ